MAFFSRGKNKVANPYTLVDFYEKYLDWVEKKEKYTVRRADFVKIVGDFNKIVADKLLEGQEFFMPAGMGSMQVLKSVYNDPILNSTAIDWKKTNELGKIIYYTNNHSDGYRYRLRWMRGGGVRGAHKIYYFIPCRDFKRTLAKIIKARKTDYYQCK